MASRFLPNALTWLCFILVAGATILWLYMALGHANHAGVKPTIFGVFAPPLLSDKSVGIFNTCTINTDENKVQSCESYVFKDSALADNLRAVFLRIPSGILDNSEVIANNTILPLGKTIIQIYMAASIFQAILLLMALGSFSWNFLKFWAILTALFTILLQFAVSIALVVLYYTCQKLPFVSDAADGFVPAFLFSFLSGGLNACAITGWVIGLGLSICCCINNDTAMC
ncbi:hypothetical protein TWF481_006245 [Arthrobotrys musiformis]|uniref:Uncharacterized protein n=1 Tax=Arthrobotrys musiformis TaxID=47236 RepID=A0AAV9WHI4_9PEZI